MSPPGLHLPHVQAILTADTLIQHFSRAIARLSQAQVYEQTDVQADLGDANRVYPAIWDHLDQAAAHLRAEGRDLREYRSLRNTVGTGTLLGVETERHNHGQVLDILSPNGVSAEHQTVTFRFNHEGLALAQAASAALKAVTPELDWPALTREAAAPVADLTKNKQWLWAATAGLFLAIFLSVVLLS